jgi:hypothetical protein
MQNLSPPKKATLENKKEAYPMKTKRILALVLSLLLILSGVAAFAEVPAFETIVFPDAMPANPTLAEDGYYDYDDMSVKLCRENGLSVVVPGKGSKGKSYAEYQAEKTGTSWKGKLKIAVVGLGQQIADDILMGQSLASLT